MNRRIGLFTFIVWSVALVANAGASEPTEYVLAATGSIEIGPDGSVNDYTVDNDLAAPIASAIDRHVRSWRFQPVRIDGRPVIAKSRMHLSLRAVPAGDNLELRVDEVSFGGAGEPSEATKREHPLRYPRRAREERLGARVLLAVRTDASGKVIEVHPYQTSLSQRMGEGAARRWRGVFERAVMDIVAQWTFDPGEVIDGTPMAGRFLMPVEFTIGTQRPHPDAWRTYVPGPVDPAPWFDIEPEQSARIAALGDGDTLSLESRFVRLDDATPAAAPRTPDT